MSCASARWIWKTIEIKISFFNSKHNTTDALALFKLLISKLHRLFHKVKALQFWPTPDMGVNHASKSWVYTTLNKSRVLTTLISHGCQFSIISQGCKKYKIHGCQKISLFHLLTYLLITHSVTSLTEWWVCRSRRARAACSAALPPRTHHAISHGCKQGQYSTPLPCQPMTAAISLYPHGRDRVIVVILVDFVSWSSYCCRYKFS